MSDDAETGSPENFETALRELEQLVDSLEQGDLSLEDSLLKFERGIKLARQCQQSLDQAEQRVRVLVEQSGESQLQDLAPE